MCPKVGCNCEVSDSVDKLRSRLDLGLGLQIDALQEAGCTKTFTDEGVSGAAVIKPKLIEALTYAL